MKWLWGHKVRIQGVPWVCTVNDYGSADFGFDVYWYSENGFNTGNRKVWLVK
jgi:hypothetical protein